MMSEGSASSAHDRDKALYHYAENVAFTASTNPSALLTSARGSKGSIHDKLFELYLKHFNQTPQATACPNLLSVLVKRDNLNTLIINLKPLEQGYSVLIKSLTGNLVETINLPYTETELLDCIEQEEIPPTIVDLLEQTQSDLFYDGCVIAEVRDGRRGASGAYKTSYFLLKPSHRTILADINALTNDQFRWSQDDRFILESKLLLATNEPLCLDPTPAVGIIRNRLAYKKRIAQSPLLTRSLRPFTAKGIQKRRLLAKLPFHKELPILAFLKSRGNKSRYAHPRDSHIRTPWTHGKIRLPLIPLHLSTLSDVRRLAKELEKPHVYHHLATGSKHLATDCTPVVVEEYTMETERPMGKLHRSRLIILKKPSEDKYIGELHIDRSEYSSNKCVFELGTAPLKDKYISQFIEIFTEEGRRQVKIVHSLPGQTPKIVYTSGAAGQINLSQSSTALTASQNVVHITAGTSSSAPAGNQSGNRLSTETPPTIRLSADNQSAIKFSLSSQASALSNSLQQQGESHNSAHSLSSTDSSGASLVLARQGLKIQGALLPSAQTLSPPIPSL
ncbi:hypothetical protein EB796_007396 [Bugula neritina]|uniref:Spt20-like SEP domain-containing protein n=1 Tax=Bugula neritina TaxID=10212 RepID=A0A7J7K6Q0_BUGNE|nr:hypothetical protein EB796_007396 [Bugula neritina]